MKHAKSTMRFFCALICFSLLFFFLLPVRASAPEPPSTEEATAYYLYHLESERAVGSKNLEGQIYAGSSVKIMSGLLLCEGLADRLNETVTVTAEMISNVWGYRLYLKKGDVLTVEDLLYGAICGSYNDAFYVLACHLAGSTDTFVNQMNQRAGALGMNNTVYTDPCGINDNSTTTAADVARVSLAAYENELFLRLCGTPKYKMPATLEYQERTIYNRNAMIASQTTNQYYNQYCIGMNAGSTNKGGNSVIALTRCEGETYLCIVMGAKETNQTEYGYVVANRLIKWVYQTYSYMEVISPEEPVCTIPVTVSDMTTEVEVRTKESLKAYLPAGAEIGKDVLYSIRLTYTELEAPVTEGIHVGYLAIVYEDRVIGTVDLYTAGSAERSTIVSSLKAIQSLTKSRPVLAGLIFFALALGAWIVTEMVVNTRRRRKWDKYFSNKMELHPDLFNNKK